MEPLIPTNWAPLVDEGWGNVPWALREPNANRTQSNTQAWRFPERGSVDASVRRCLGLGTQDRREPDALDAARAAVEQIDAALDRIKAGTYGICVTSGLAIPQERLRAIPWAAERVEYKVGGLGRL